MQRPYLISVILFLSLALLGTVDSALTSVGWVQWLNSLGWLSVHFISIGVVGEVVFGVLPVLVAERAGSPRPPTRWDIWASLTGGLVILMTGLPSVNAALMIGGGSLILLATLLLMQHLAMLRAPLASTGLPFYLTGLSYLLIGGFLGMGIWLDWGSWLQLGNVKEVHVHANLWGFLSPIFAGLLLDLYPKLTGKSLAWARWAWGIAALMGVGALGLVAGPWLEMDMLTTIGLILHTVGTLWLLAAAIKPLIGTGALRQPGVLQLLTSYIWFFIPVVVAPLIVANAENFPVAQFASNGGPILIYGWALQFSIALIPSLAAKTLDPAAETGAGGSWLSLAAFHIGGVAYWLGLFLINQQGWLHALAFGLWTVAMIPVMVVLWRLISARGSALAADLEAAI